MQSPSVPRRPVASYLDFVIDEVARALIASGHVKSADTAAAWWTFSQLARDEQAGMAAAKAEAEEVEAMDVDELEQAGAEVERRGARAPSGHRSRHPGRGARGRERMSGSRDGVGGMTHASTHSPLFA